MIKYIGIVGSGKMGVGVFNYLSDFEYHITWYILFDDEKEKLEKSFHKKIGRQFKNEIISESDFNRKFQYKFTTDIQDFESCDLIIESITEDISEKKNLFKSLERIVNSECLFVSNSSSILPSDLKNKIEVFGMHFFYPVAFKDTVELVVPDNSDDRLISELIIFLRIIKKNAFVQTEKSAFLLNRFLLHIQLKALEYIRIYDISFKQIDFVSKELIPDFGLFEMMDHVGHQTMFNSIQNYSILENNEIKFNDLLGELKIRIETKTDFCSDEDPSNIDESIALKVKNTLQAEIEEIQSQFANKFEIDSKLFNEYLDDFCGLNN
jgi:3-hydroxybutyryl-CoA dehydrogenase